MLNIIVFNKGFSVARDPKSILALDQALKVLTNKLSRAEGEEDWEGADALDLPQLAVVIGLCTYQIYKTQMATLPKCQMHTANQ